MQQIRFVQVGPGINGLLHTLRDKLNAAQDRFLFTFEDDAIELKEGDKATAGEYPTAKLEKDTVDYFSDHKYVEYPVCVTSYRLTDDFIYNSTDRVACISVADWESFSRASPLKGLLFCIGAVLIDRRVNTDSHDTPVGCPNDLCWDKKEIDLGIQACDYCPDCQKKIYSAIERRQLFLEDVAAVYRIFDATAGRKLCFVIMPFVTKLNNVYATVRNTLLSHGYICKRADDVARTTDIVDIILEQIGRACVVLADLTGRNANVFYELGYAHALGKDTILIVQKGESVPFDANHRQYIEYDPEDLEKTLADPIKRYL